MVITYNGDDYFKFQSGELSILVDPTNQRSFKGADVILNTQKPALIDKPKSDDGENEPFWIDHAGEYEVKGICMRGWQISSDNKKQSTVYRVDFDGFRMVFFGYLADEPGTEIIEHLEHVDIAVVPAGGKPLIVQSEVARFLRQLEPALIIPALYKNTKELGAFLKEFNRSKCELQDKLTIRKKDINMGTMIIHCLRGA